MQLVIYPGPPLHPPDLGKLASLKHQLVEKKNLQKLSPFFPPSRLTFSSPTHSLSHPIHMSLPHSQLPSASTPGGGNFLLTFPEPAFLDPDDPMRPLPPFLYTQLNDPMGHHGNQMSDVTQPATLFVEDGQFQFSDGYGNDLAG